MSMDSSFASAMIELECCRTTACVLVCWGKGVRVLRRWKEGSFRGDSVNLFLKGVGTIFPPNLYLLTYSWDLRCNFVNFYI